MQAQQTPFGELLRQFRRQAGLSQADLAERAKVSAAAVATLERGVRRSPHARTVQALADALGVSATERALLIAAANHPRQVRESSDSGHEQFAPRAASAAMAPLIGQGGQPPAATALLPDTPNQVLGVSAPRGRARLAAPLLPLVGREADVAAGCALLDPTASQARLLTVVGPGGVGKTALGRQLAFELQAHFEAAWLVELAPIDDPALVAETVAAVLGVPEAPNRSTLATLAGFLEHARGLLVLDNCEHLLESCFELATYLLPACPGLRLLATSREPLQVPGERVLRLAALAAPEPDDTLTVDQLRQYGSVRLFEERVRAVDPSFQLTPGTVRVVTQVCARLAGLPLALELAASRLQVLSLDQLLARLDQAFSILGGGARAAPTRQQTLRATLDWSYGLLTEPEQAVFRRLAVVAGTCNLEAAEAICQGDDVPAADVLDLVARLVNKSLLLAARGGVAARYRMLEPVRQYAEHRLATSGEEPRIRLQHAAWYLALAERARPELDGPHQTAWLERLDQERDNLRVALRWLREYDDSERELRLVAALGPYWEARGHLSEGRRSIEAALAAPGPSGLSPVHRRDAVHAAALIAHWQADLDAAQAFAEESLRLSRALDDAAGVGLAHAMLGTLARLRGRLTESVALLEQSLAALYRLGDRRTTARTLLTLAVTLRQLGDLARARPLFEESLALFRELGDLRYAAMTLTELGHCMLDSGEVAAGARLLTEGLLGQRRVGNFSFLHFGLSGLANAAAVQAQPVLAARLLGAAEAARERVGALLTPNNRPTHERLLVALRAQLGDANFTSTFAAGAALSPDEAIDEALAEVPPTADAGVPNSFVPDGRLTPREREVAALLARGCSDRQIAEMLSIGMGTVGVHVHHLLQKLDLRSRWQVADWARDRGMESL